MKRIEDMTPEEIQAEIAAHGLPPISGGGVVAALPIIMAGIDAIPQIMTMVNNLIASARALGASEEELRARVAGKELLLDPMIAFWGGYSAKRHPDDR